MSQNADLTKPEKVDAGFVGNKVNFFALQIMGLYPTAKDYLKNKDYVIIFVTRFMSLKKAEITTLISKVEQDLEVTKYIESLHLRTESNNYLPKAFSTAS